MPLLSSRSSLVMSCSAPQMFRGTKVVSSQPSSSGLFAPANDSNHQDDNDEEEQSKTFIHREQQTWIRIGGRNSTAAGELLVSFIFVKVRGTLLHP